MPRLKNGAADNLDFNHFEHVGVGDQVGVVSRWQWPDVMDDVQVRHLRETQTIIAAGRYRESVQAFDWVGNAVAQVLRMDASSKAVRSKISGILKTWIANRMLKVVVAQDPQARKMVKYVEVDQWAND